MRGENVNSLIIKGLCEKPIAFNPELARLAGSAIAGLFMSQLLYWWGKGHRKDCIYKTIDEYEKETTLTRSEQDRAIKKWERVGVLIVKREGIPQKRHFYLNVDKIVDLLDERMKKKGIEGHYRVEADN
jgi:hypothetical protein